MILLRVDLKDSAALQRFILNGRVFHSRFWGYKGKSSLPICFTVTWLRGCTRSSLSDERNDSTGVKSGRIKLDDNVKKEFSGKKKIHNTVTDSSQSSLDELGINASQFTASRVYARRILRLRR